MGLTFLEPRNQQWRYKNKLASLEANLMGGAAAEQEEGEASRRRDCHSAAPLSNFIRCFNMDGEGVSSK